MNGLIVVFIALVVLWVVVEKAGNSMSGFALRAYSENQYRLAVFRLNVIKYFSPDTRVWPCLALCYAKINQFEKAEKCALKFSQKSSALFKAAIFQKISVAALRNGNYYYHQKFQDRSQQAVRDYLD